MEARGPSTSGLRPFAQDDRGLLVLQSLIVIVGSGLITGELNV